MAPAPNQKRIPVIYERRCPQGFAISAPLTYAVGRSYGRGIACHISNDEVLIKADEEVPLGRIRLFIDWPAKLGEQRLEVVVEGMVLSSTSEGAAVQILEYRYRAPRSE